MLDSKIVRLELHWPYLPICFHHLAQRWHTKDALKLYRVNKWTAMWTQTYLQNMNSQTFVTLSTLRPNLLVSAFPAHILIFIEPIWPGKYLIPVLELGLPVAKFQMIHNEQWKSILPFLVSLSGPGHSYILGMSIPVIPLLWQSVQ